MTSPTAGQPFNFAQHLLSLNTARADKARMLEIGAQAAIAARGIAEKYYGTKA